jgi:hypothetical protein
LNVYDTSSDVIIDHEDNEKVIEVTNVDDTNGINQLLWELDNHRDNENGFYNNNTSQRYFMYEKRGYGVQYLNSYSQYQNESCIQTVDLFESQTMLYLSYLVRSLTFQQRSHLTELLRRVIHMNKTRNDDPLYEQNISPTDVPMSYAELR